MQSSTLSVLILTLVGLGIIVVIWQTMTRGRWGLGPLRANCPRCGTKLPMIRKPTSADEALWGGWTCPNCGAKVDKYGKERAPGQIPPSSPTPPVQS